MLCSNLSYLHKPIDIYWNFTFFYKRLQAFSVNSFRNRLVFILFKSVVHIQNQKIMFSGVDYIFIYGKKSRIFIAINHYKRIFIRIQVSVWISFEYCSFDSQIESNAVEYNAWMLFINVIRKGTFTEHLGI